MTPQDLALFVCLASSVAFVYASHRNIQKAERLRKRIKEERPSWRLESEAQPLRAPLTPELADLGRMALVHKMHLQGKALRSADVAEIALAQITIPLVAEFAAQYGTLRDLSERQGARA